MVHHRNYNFYILIFLLLNLKIKDFDILYNSFVDLLLNDNDIYPKLQVVNYYYIFHLMLLFLYNMELNKNYKIILYNLIYMILNNLYILLHILYYIQLMNLFYEYFLFLLNLLYNLCLILL